MTDREANSGHHDAKLDFSSDMSYGDYLGLDALLDAQHPQSGAHDEMLFIIQHQTSELLMRLAIHELQGARRAIIDHDLRPAFKMLARVARIFEQLNGAWDVLRTMTPSEYTAFRPALGNSFGLAVASVPVDRIYSGQPPNRFEEGTRSHGFGACSFDC